MAEYHVGCGAFGIYAGTLNKNKDKWINKSNVTDEACSAVAQFLIEHQKCLKFTYNGQHLQLEVSTVKE